jgi:hypothetical protein
MTGFVYIWHDKKHNRYYIGSHWGAENDGYICSSHWMLRAYSRRPQDFKRRIIKRNIQTKIEVFSIEQYFLSMIKKEEIKTRYYNLNTTNAKNHWFGNEERTKTVSEKISIALTGRKQSKETKQKRSTSLQGHSVSEHTRQRASETHKNKILSEETLEKLKPTQFKKGQIAHNKGKEADEETKLRLKQMNENNIWITNGTESKKIKTYVIIPQGWQRGRIIKWKTKNKYMK